MPERDGCEPSRPNPIIALSAGEASGDVSGKHLVIELRKLRPDLRFWGAGGPKMREAGVDVVLDMTGSGVIGISATVKSLPVTWTRYLIFRRMLLRRPPDLFIPIDFGAFNLRLAQVLHERGVPVVYYFPPSSWRRQPKNASKLLAAGGKVITPFRWSAEYLARAGVDARWVGHPVLDTARPTTEKTTFLRELGLSDSQPVIGLLPGTRSHEIGEHLQPMIGCAEIIKREIREAQFLLAAAKGARVPVKKQPLLGSLVHVVKDRTCDCMAASDLLICKSGTATLEAAVIGTPMVIVYRGTPIMRLEYRLRRHELEEFIGMPNILAGREICPEFLNEEVTAERLASAALDILNDPTRLARMRESLAEVRKSLGEPGAVERAARAVLEMGGLAVESPER